MADDPYVMAYLPDDPQLYGGPVHAKQDFDCEEQLTYQYDDLLRFKVGTDERTPSTTH